MKRRRKNKAQELAIGTTKMGLIIGAGTVVAPSAGANLAMVGSFTPGVIAFGMGSSMAGKFGKLRKVYKKKKGRKLN